MLFKNILVPFDGSDASERAARYAIQLSTLQKASITFIHIIDDIKQGGVIGLRARYGDIGLVEAYKKTRRQEAEEWIKPLEKEATDNGTKTAIKIVDEEGSSKIGIITEYIEKNNIDLIVTGSRGHTRFKKLQLGGIASAIISHSNCPVLVIR